MGKSPVVSASGFPDSAGDHSVSAACPEVSVSGPPGAAGPASVASAESRAATPWAAPAAWVPPAVGEAPSGRQRSPAGEVRGAGEHPAAPGRCCSPAVRAFAPARERPRFWGWRAVTPAWLEPGRATAPPRVRRPRSRFPCAGRGHVAASAGPPCWGPSAWCCWPSPQAAAPRLPAHRHPP